MISYNTKDWFTFIFRFHKADTVRKLFPLMLAIGAYAIVVAYLEIEVWKLKDHPYIKNIPVMHTLLGFALSMLLVFRTNSAYDRWWEGRKLWGSLVNNSRNLALKVNAILPPSSGEERAFFRRMITSYAQALHAHLRRENTRIELFDLADRERIAFLQEKNAHVPNHLAAELFGMTDKLYRDGKLSGEQLLFINPELLSFTDICGACERIKNTPIPFSYSVFIKKFIFFYVMTLPFGYVFSLGYLVVPVMIFVFYVLASLEMIAEEIEDPFGGDENDVPTERLAETIRSSVQQIFDEDLMR